MSDDVTRYREQLEELIGAVADLEMATSRKEQNLVDSLREALIADYAALQQQLYTVQTIAHNLGEESDALTQQLASLKNYCEDRAQELGWPGHSQGGDPAAYLFDRIVEQKQQLVQAQGERDAAAKLNGGDYHIACQAALRERDVLQARVRELENDVGLQEERRQWHAKLAAAEARVTWLERLHQHIHHISYPIEETAWYKDWLAAEPKKEG